MDNILSEKRCTKCGKIKTINCFYASKFKASGYRSNCKECILEKNNEYKNKNIEKERKRSREYGLLHKKERLCATKTWRLRNPERTSELRKIYNSNRRAMTNGTFTLEEWKNLCSKYGNRCLRCGEDKKLTVDHIIPISLGGSNTIDNLQPLCDFCNKSKGAKYADYR